MPTCTACASPLREGARFCTRCGAPVAAVVAVPSRILVPSRIPVGVPTSSRAPRGAAIGALIAGAAPLLISVVGNLVAAELARAAVGGAQAGAAEGVWAPVLFVLSLVFVLTAGALTICGILGTRALREITAGRARGRGLAIAGLAVGGVNLVLWIAGIVVTVGTLGALVI